MAASGVAKSASQKPTYGALGLRIARSRPARTASPLPAFRSRCKMSIWAGISDCNCCNTMSVESRLPALTKRMETSRARRRYFPNSSRFSLRRSREVTHVCSRKMTHQTGHLAQAKWRGLDAKESPATDSWVGYRSEEHTSELQSRQYLVCRLLLEKRKN